MTDQEDVKDQEDSLQVKLDSQGLSDNKQIDLTEINLISDQSFEKQDDALNELQNKKQDQGEVIVQPAATISQTMPSSQSANSMNNNNENQDEELLPSADANPTYQKLSPPPVIIDQYSPQKQAQQQSGTENTSNQVNAAALNNQQSIQVTQSDMQQQTPIAPQQQTIFKDIMDTTMEITKMNFIPALICLKQGQTEINEKDNFGYTLLHHAVSLNQKDLVIYLIQKGADVNIVNKQNQTPLMMATNYGNIEIFKLLVDKGANYIGIDQFSFSCLLYSIKQNQMPLFFYLLFLGANIQDCDQNHSNIAHWSGYKNNEFILRFLKRVGLDLVSPDGQQFAPINRAIMNFSYESIKFLANAYPDEITKINYNTIQSSKGIIQILRKAYFWRENNVAPRILQQYQKQLTLILHLVYYFTIVCLVSVYMFSENVKTMNEKTIYLWINLIFLMLTFFFVYYISWFLRHIGSGSEMLHSNLKGSHHSQQVDHQLKYLIQDNHNIRKQIMDQKKLQNRPDYLKNINLNDYTYLDFKHLNKLMKQGDYDPNLVASTDNVSNEEDEQQEKSIIQIQKMEDELGLYNIEQNQSFMHEIAILFEANRFLELRALNFKRICPTCLKFKPPKTKHCSICNICVPDFNHHSIIFGKCINSSNHLAYFLLLLQQQILLSMFMILNMIAYWHLRTSSFWLSFFEIISIIWSQESRIKSLFFILSFVLLFYNSLYFITEVYGICTNMTRNEIFNSHRYKYLFTNIFDLRKNSTIFARKNYFENGIINNIKQYFKNSLYTLMVR